MLALAAAAAVYASAFYNVLENILGGVYMDQNWFYRGNALIHSLSEQETTSHSVAVWRIGQCGVFLKYNGKIILIDPVLEPIYGKDGVCRTHFEPPFSADANFSVDAVFCTHNHLDHFQPDTICKLAASHPNVKFFVPTGILDEIQECIASFADRVTGIRQGQQLELFQNISVTAVAVPHDVYRADANGNEKALGYVFIWEILRFFIAEMQLQQTVLLQMFARLALFILLFCQSMAEIGLESHVILLVI